MGVETLFFGTLCLTVLAYAIPTSEERPFLIAEREPELRGSEDTGPGTYPKKEGPFKRAAPLDINDNVGHTLALINQLVGTVGGSSSGLVMGLSGVSITDCESSLHGVDLNTLSCEDFLDTISNCDSLQNIKPLLQQAKKKYQKKPNSKAPCFKNKSRKQKKH